MQLDGQTGIKTVKYRGKDMQLDGQTGIKTVKYRGKQLQRQIK